jgi:phosphoribosyl-ATP pyrophosphohydrolase
MPYRSLLVLRRRSRIRWNDPGTLSLVEDRRRKRPPGSYTTKLFEDGIDKIVKKLGEEAVETVIAAKNESSERIVQETSDLLYHLIVTLVAKGVSLEEIKSELVKRHRAGYKH